MYTATIDSLALPLALEHLLSEPKHGKLVRGSNCRESAVFPSQPQSHYIYIPNAEFTGIEEFDFLSPNGIRTTVTIHVNEATNGFKLFIPFIKENAKVTHSDELYLFA